MEQITRPEQLLIGRTVINTGKFTSERDETQETISFIFSDNSFMIFRLVNNNGLKFSDIPIETDFKKWEEAYKAKYPSATEYQFISNKFMHAKYLRTLKLLANEQEFVNVCKEYFQAELKFEISRMQADILSQEEYKAKLEKLNSSNPTSEEEVCDIYYSGK